MQTGLSPRISDKQAAEMLRDNPGFVQSDLSDPFEATRQTVVYMCKLIRDAFESDLVGQAVWDSRRFAGFANDYICASIWWWVKHAIKFVHHQKLFERWHIGDGNELQLLISPDALLRMSKPQGDCAVFTCLICALLDRVGVKWEIVTVAVDPNQPGVFSHVYPRCVFENGERMPMDASHGKFPGWEVPKRAYTGPRQIWNSHGEAIDDQDSGYRGLHGVPMLRGLGQEALDIQEGGDYVPPPPADQIFYTGSSGGGSGAGLQLAGNLLNQWTGIASKVIAPTTQYTRNADGSISFSAPSNSAAASSVLSSGSLFGAGTSSSSLLLIGGLAVAALLLVSMFKK